MFNYMPYVMQDVRQQGFRSRIMHGYTCLVV